MFAYGSSFCLFVAICLDEIKINIIICTQLYICTYICTYNSYADNWAVFNVSGHYPSELRLLKADTYEFLNWTPAARYGGESHPFTTPQPMTEQLCSAKALRYPAKMLPIFQVRKDWTLDKSRAFQGFDHSWPTSGLWVRSTNCYSAVLDLQHVELAGWCFWGCQHSTQ